mgnify:FL=1
METELSKVHAKVVVIMTPTEVGLVGHGCRTRGARIVLPCPTKVQSVDVNSYVPKLNNLLLMGFYKKTKMKVNGKWYPKSVLVMSSVTTEQVAKRIATESTVSPADVRAVLTALGGVMGDYMSQGRSVKLDGIGSFYFTAVTTKNGVDKPEEVNATLIRGVRVRFIPETRYRGAGKGRVSTRGLSDVDIDWEEWKGEEKGEKKEKKKKEESVGPVPE